MSRMSRLLLTVFGGKPNLIDSGANYINWVLAGSGTTAGVDGIHLVQDGSNDYAKIIIPTVKINTVYTIRYVVKATSLDSTFAVPRITDGCPVETVILSQNIGVNFATFTTVANVATKKYLYFVCTAENTNGRYIDFTEVYVVEGSFV